jgi:regulator of sigma E protease
VIRDGIEPVNITVQRNGETLVIQNVKFPIEIDNGIKYGAVDFRTRVEEKTFGISIKQVFYQSLSTIDMVWSSIFDLITGRYSINEAAVGPVGVTQEIGKSAKEGKTSFLFLLTLITINLGIVNLLPLPALDGGKIVFLLIELVRRKPIKPEYEGYVHLAGMVILLLFLAIITYKDIVKIFVK